MTDNKVKKEHQQGQEKEEVEMIDKKAKRKSQKVKVRWELSQLKLMRAKISMI